jgi:integrase
MKLTEDSVKKLRATTKRQHIYDDASRGFGVRVEAAALGGRMNYFWRAKVDGQVFYKSLGECGITPLKQARENARRYAGQALDWKVGGYLPEQNPFRKKKPAKATAAAKVPTFAELRDAYCLQHVREHANRPDLAERRVLDLCKYLKDWNSRAIDSIGVADVLAVKNAQGQHRVTANRVVEFLRALYNWSAKSVDGKINFWPVAANPAKDVSRYKEVPRERFIRPSELGKFNEALKDEPDRDLRDFIVISLGTGARRNNVLSMRWEDLTWESQSWHIPLAKNGEGYDVALLDVVMKVLERRRAEIAESTPFVFPADSSTGHRVDVKKRWQVFRVRAGVPDLKIHDLRRTTGSMIAMAGQGLPAVAEALGHRSLASTKIYARFDEQKVREAREAGQKKMVSMMRQAKKRNGRKLLTS